MIVRLMKNANVDVTSLKQMDVIVNVIIESKNMTIKQFIETAIEGGYTNNWFQDLKVDEQQEVFGTAEDIWKMCPNIFLDPEAWKAVGKVKQWDDVSDCVACDYPGWQLSVPAKMHGMIKALLKGQTLEEYIETL